MKPYNILIFIFLSSTIITKTFAQDLDEIQRKAKQNQQNSQSGNSNSNNTSSSNSNNSGSNDCCSPGSIDGCFLLGQGCIALGAGIHTAQTNMLAKKHDITEMVSFEIRTNYHASLGTQNGIFKPSIRGNWGLFSMEMRYFNLHGTNVFNQKKSFDYLDWQILMLNLFAKKEFKLRIGTGLSLENYTSTNFNENTIQLEITPINKFSIIGEGRWIKDYQTNMQVRTEAMVGFNYKLFDSNSVKTMLEFMTTYHRIYETDPFWTIGGGLRLRFE